MKNTNRLLTAAATAAIITGLATSAFAQTNLLISLDENGNGFLNGVRLTISIDQEPISQIETLHYHLPFYGFTNRVGDVVLMEPGTPGTISDILRFDGVGNVWFFSEREASDVPPFDLADVAILPMVWTNNFVMLDEVGPEGQNGASYTPLPSQPGYYGADVKYELISDIPEASTFALAGLGAAVLMIFRRRW
jgi:hypothetical protein